MFTMHKIYGGEDVVLPPVYVDQINTWYTIENVKIQATMNEESLTLPNVQATVIFQSGGTDYTFPLAGATFLAVKTGTLKVRVSQSLAAGIHLYPFMAEQTLLTLAGMRLAGMARYASEDVLHFPLPAYVQVQVLGDVQPFTYTVPFVTN